TIFSRDWSSDVCSSDLGVGDLGELNSRAAPTNNVHRAPPVACAGVSSAPVLGRCCLMCQTGCISNPLSFGTPRLMPGSQRNALRSEERRVGKDCKSDPS